MQAAFYVALGNELSERGEVLGNIVLDIG